MNNKRHKQIFIISVIVFFTGFLVYDYYANNCSIYNLYFLADQKIIDKKYVYTVHGSNIEETYCTSECDKIKYIVDYPNNFVDSNIRNMANGIGYISPFEYREILKYNFDDSIAFIKVYNEGARMVKETYTIVSMKCLHDTLPAGELAIE